MLKNYKTFIVFIILTAIWSCVFSTVKYFLWGDLQAGIAPDLQVISGYLSLGGVIAYLFGGAIVYTFLKKYLLFTFSFLSFIFVVAIYFFPIQSNIGLFFVISFLGLFYGLWVILRGVLTSIEIQKTGLGDTKVNGIVSIVFIIFLIAGTILGSKLFESMGHSGLLVIMGLLLSSSVISLFLDYEKVSLKSLFHLGFKKYRFDKTNKFKNALKEYIPELKYIIKNFGTIILSSSLIWAVSTVVSQKAVEYSVLEFDKLPSEAAFLLLYSSVGAILGNIISSFLGKYRWKSFFILNLLLGVLIFVFPFFNSSFLEVGIIAFLVGLAFGAATNLVDAYYLAKIGEEDKKEYGSSTLGLVLSIIIFITMFLSSYIDNNFGFNTLMYVLGAIIFAVGLFNIKRK